MGIRLSESEFNDQCAMAEEAADNLPALYHQVVELRKLLARDGFPTRSAGTGEGGATNIVHEFVLEDGTTEKVTVPQHSDPVGEAVWRAEEAGGEHWDRALTAASDAVRAGNSALADATDALNLAEKRVRSAVRAYDSARGQLERARTPPPEQVVSELGVAWCFNCGRYKWDGDTILTPTYRIGPDFGDGTPARPRCRSCYDFTTAAIKTRAGGNRVADPAWPLEQPKTLVLMRHRGDRVFDADIDAAVKLVKEQAARVGRAGAEAASR